MRHAKKGRKFGRKRDQRRAFLKSLAVNLIMKGKIKTTESRAKEMRGFIEPLITKVKKSDLTSVRTANKFLSAEAAKKLLKDITPKYAERPGGYTKIVKIGARNSDGARMVYIELV